MFCEPKLSFIITFILFITLASPFQIKVWEQGSEERVSQIPLKMFAGEIHYSRIPVEYWEHRIQMVKALGLNALSIYIMWNYHEISKGNFDYSTENKNLSLFLDLAEKYDLKVLIRPGPYICAEWDFGGLPARLLSINGLVIRANNNLFLDEVKIYFESLAPILKKHINSKENPKGSIVLLQIQNEYGFYGSDKSYIEELRRMWRDLDVNCDQYYVDWVENIQKCHWTGANIGINNGIEQVQFEYVRTFQKTGYLLGGEIYSGWLTHWSEQWQSKSISKVNQEYGFLMAYNHSYSMYMVHGGSNFALTAGANAFKNKSYDYLPHVTSYDYDAPINEQGNITPKYLSLRNLIKQYATWQIPEIPDRIKSIEIEKFVVQPVGKLFNNLGKGVESSKPQVFESEKLGMFEQGIVVYSTTIKRSVDFFKVKIHDYGIIYLDGKYIGTADRCKQINTTFPVQCYNDSCQLTIVVEAMGHVNFDQQMQTDFKGIIEISDTKGQTFNWTMYKVNINSDLLKWEKAEGELQNNPILSKGTFNISSVGDTYLDMQNFGKGYVWVNGRNLGRYWSIGPQKRVFCPGVWLTNGFNTVHVLELRYNGVQTIQGKTTLN